jgi:hypothetical protein
MYRTEKYCGAQCVLSHGEKRVFETSNTVNPALAFTFAGSFATLAAIRRASTLVYSPSKQFFCLPTDRQQ